MHSPSSPKPRTPNRAFDHNRHNYHDRYERVTSLTPEVADKRWAVVGDVREGPDDGGDEPVLPPGCVV